MTKSSVIWHIPGFTANYTYSSGTSRVEKGESQAGDNILHAPATQMHLVAVS